MDGYKASQRGLLLPTHREESGMEDEIKELYEQGYGISEICNRLDMPFGVVYRVIKNTKPDSLEEDT